MSFALVRFDVPDSDPEYSIVRTSVISETDVGGIVLVEWKQGKKPWRKYPATVICNGKIAISIFCTVL